jgi:hypothetical protein
LLACYKTFLIIRNKLSILKHQFAHCIQKKRLLPTTVECVEPPEAKPLEPEDIEFGKTLFWTCSLLMRNRGWFVCTQRQINSFLTV